MMKTLVFLVIFVSANLLNVKCESGFVTLFTPKFVQEDAPYQIFIHPTDVHQKTEVAIQFRQSSAALTLSDQRVSTIEFQSKQRFFGKKKELDLIMTLYRNISTISGTKMYCSTKSISIETRTGNFYNFIQTDKPIYKPGDLVQFRILTIDKDLKPFHRNTINVTITDPFDRTIETFEDQAGQFSGVFESNFTLSSITVLGDWKITVIVDKKPHMATSKVFAVQKYTLPLFDVHIDIPERHVLQQDNVTFSIYGRYSFGDFVNGNAELVIRDPVNGKEFLNSKLSSIKAPHVVNYNLTNLGVETMDETKLEVFVRFTEPQSNITFTKTASFYAHYDEQHKMIVNHAEKFLPGFPFAMRIHVHDWKGNRIQSHYEKIVLSYKYKLRNETTGELHTLGELRDGVYASEYRIPKEYTELSISADFPNSKPYEKDIPMGSVSVGINSLIVEHSPVEPKLYDNVKVFVTSETKLNSIIMAVVTRFGIIENRQISCNDEKICEFEVRVSEKMMPHSTIMVYDIRDKNIIHQGQTKIETEDVGRSKLQLELPTKPVRTNQNISMTFTSQQAKSTVYLLAFDKRLKFLRDGNDITKPDVIQTLADYDGENQILVNDLTKWDICTPEEVERVEKGRVFIGKQSGNKFTPREPDDESNVEDEDWDSDHKEDEATPDDVLREYFPETWIFETFQLGRDKTLTKQFTTPDAITTWLVSAFSVHGSAGVALSPTQELDVKNDFFVKMDLPYSIRYKEVLKLKILVFNYVKTNEELNVKLRLVNTDGRQFEFVDYHNCKPTYNTDAHTFAEANVKVPHGEVRTVHFYIRSRQTSIKDPNVDEKINILVKSIGTDNRGNTYKDNVLKTLKIEPVGIKVYSITSNFYNLNYNDQTKLYIKESNYSGDLSNINVIVSGDFLTKTMKLETVEPFATQCLEQRTSKLKRYVDSFRFLKFTNKQPETKEATQLYQNVLSALDSNYNYMNHAWYRAYLGNILGLAMESGALTKDMRILFETLDKVDKLQESNGTFSNFNFYYGFPDRSGADYSATLQYFASAYCLVPFLRHREMLGTRYDLFIERGIRYLREPKNRLTTYSFGWSIAAYAFALNGDIRDAKELITRLEKVKSQQQNIKCYKIFEDDTECHVRHTAFVALALIKLNMLPEAEPVVYWLMGRKQEDDVSAGMNAAMTEPIAEMAFKLRSSDTNLNVIVKDEHSFSKNVSIKDFNSHISQTIQLPDYSEKVIYEMSGNGYCTMTMLFERIVKVPVLVEQFSITKNTNINIFVPNHRIVEICAKYVTGFIKKPILVNVIYEIDMPSGYTFVGVKDVKKHPEIKQIDPKKGGTLVHLYYNDFKADTNYCVIIEAKREFIVNELSDAGIRIYDYENKDGAGIDFYRFDSAEC